MSETEYNKPATGFITLADGRRLSYARYGKTSGRPLFYFHGLPGSRYECQLIHEPAREAGVSVIAPDRPGYGFSQIGKEYTLCAWTQDIAALADQLGIHEFIVVGVSGGAPCAMACAHEMPNRVTTVGLVAGLGPVAVRELLLSMSWPTRLSFFLADRIPALFEYLVAKPTMKLARTHPETLIKLLAAANGEADKRVLLEPPVLRAFTFSIQACFSQGSLGSLEDLRLFQHAWGFEPGDITQRTYLWHGTRDSIVPLVHSRYLDARLPNSTLEIVDQEGHFSLPLKHIEEILNILLKTERVPGHRHS